MRSIIANKLVACNHEPAAKLSGSDRIGAVWNVLLTVLLRGQKKARIERTRSKKEAFYHYLTR